MSLSARIITGLALGLLAGIVVGEPLGVLEPAGEAFVRLLQMTVLPYVVVSLIAGLGHLDLSVARRLGLWGGALLVLLWVISFGVVAIMPLGFPTLESASFYSTTLVDPPAQVDFVALYIPSNPFHALANNIVPAVVVFSLALGVALIGIPERGSLLRALDTLSDALLRVNAFVVRFTPFGVFFIAASAAGTMSVEEFQRVQVYLVSYALFSLIATFWLLPGLLDALTEIRRREALMLLRDAMVTSFATGSSFVVIPLVAEASRKLVEPHVANAEDAESLVNVVVPASHTFPHAAKVLSLSFILFSGWFIDSPVAPSSYPLLALSGIASTFGSVNAAIPFLLDLMRLPQDLFRLFVATSVVNARFGTLLHTMHVLVLTVLTTSAIAGALRFRWKPALRYVAITVLVLAGAVLGTRGFYAFAVDTTYRKDQILTNMNMRIETAQVPSVVHREPPPVPPPADPGQSRLETVIERGVLRVGYQPVGALPFAYFNQNGDLVGLDVEMAHSLAHGLGVSLEFVPLVSDFGQGDYAEALESGYADIIMSISVISMIRVDEVSYSRPYLDLNLGFIVRDHLRQEFAIRQVIEDWDGVRIGVPADAYYVQRVIELFPDAEVTPVKDVREFLEDDEDRFDAFAFIAEAGSAWSLLYPKFSVAVPEPRLQMMPVAYATAQGDSEWLRAVDAWLELKRADGTVDKLYDYWILGREAEEDSPRWSVLRNVLGWID